MKKVERLAIVAHGLNNGGAERVASELANGFAKLGYNVIFIATFNNEQEYLLDKKIKIYFINTNKKNGLNRLIDRNRKIYKAISEFKPDRIISFVTNELLLTLFKGYKIIFSLRNDPTKENNSFFKRICRNYEYNHAQHIVFQTKGAQDYFSDKIKKKSSVIPNPLEIEKLPIWDKENHNQSFMTAVRLNKQKNLPLMINAFKKLHEVYPEYKLEIYGRGELYNELKELIVNLGASEYIFLMGRSNKIHEIMQKSFAFILSSDYEGLSNSMLEALAIGIPCVCTDSPPGGAREYIQNMHNGILTPCGDVDALYEGLRTLVENDSLCEQFSNESLIIRDKLESSKICAQWEKLLLK